MKLQAIYKNSTLATILHIFSNVIDNMKILHIVHQYAPDFVGGTELYTATLAAEQAQRHHKVSVFVPSTQAPTVTNQTLIKNDENGINVYRVLVGSRSATQLFAETLYSSSIIVSAFQQVLAEVAPDIVHIQHLMGLPTAIIDILVQAKTPYVVTLHDYWYGCANAQLLTNYDQTICAGPNRLFTNCGRCAFSRAGQDKVAKYLAPTLAPLMGYRQHKLRQALTYAKAVIPPTRFVQTAYEQMGFNTTNFTLVPHGIKLPEELISAAKATAFEKRSALLARLVVTYIGGIAPQKGLHTLIQAFNDLPDDATLTIYGDLDKFPDYVSQLRQLITHPQITLAGRLPHDQIWSVMATADFVAIPTHWYEASPLIIDEVFAVGTPLLASRIGALTEKIRHDIDGWLVPSDDVPAWKKALHLIYTDQEMRQRLQANIRPVFSLDSHVEKIVSLYN
ncbi:MAG: glycosyltransferase involved in cell wall biosynthesis [Cellvibrionaceae bacterium]